MDRAKTLAGLMAGLLLAACSTRSPALMVASKNFTEQIILGEIIAQHIERRLGQEVKRSLNLGGTLLAHRALTLGQVDLYPEYTGTALTMILKLGPESDPALVWNRVNAEYQRRFKIEWMNPLGFDNSFAMVVRGETARARRLATLSDAAARAEGWEMAAGYEFMERPDGYPALMHAYRLKLRGPARTMDLGLLYKALVDNRVDLAAANATDGALSKLDVKVLADDRRAFPPYQAAIAVRQDSLARFPKLRAALEELSAKISADTMRELNYRVEGDHKPAAEVAAAFLSEVGLR